MLNRELKHRGITDIIFKATKGKNEGKIPIERRIIFEKDMMSRGMISFLRVKADNGETISYPTRLMYEFENIP